jgi:hypothetical protein
MMRGFQHPGPFRGSVRKATLFLMNVADIYTTRCGLLVSEAEDYCAC